MDIKCDSLTYRLCTRAKIRRNAKGRKSVEEGKPDRIADLLEEAALKIEQLETTIEDLLDALITLVQESDIENLKNMRDYLNSILVSQSIDDVERSLFAINTLIKVLEAQNED